MDIAIFGAGIAGLMTAITLHPQGHRCRIYERNPRGHETGMGFILMPEGIDCMQRFGVHLDAFPLDHYYCRDSAGHILLQQTMPAGARSVRRRDLIASILRALPRDTALTFDAELGSLEFDESGKVTAARLSSGELIHADVYVAADGTGSRARKAMFPDWPVASARVKEVVGLVRCDQAIRWAGRDFNKFHAPDGGIALGVLAVDAETVVWYLQFDSERFSPPPEFSSAKFSGEARRAFVQKLVGKWPHPIPSLLAQTDFSRVHVSHPMDTDLVPRFYQSNLVLVGDAAHPLSPFTSQGVSSAIADAVVLSNALNSQQGLAPALARYSNERRERCASYLARGRDLARRFLAPLVAENLALPVAESEHLPLTDMFSDDAVPMNLLRERAFNLRWAQQPPGVIPLTAADPDFPICPAIGEQLVRYVRDGVFSYGPPEGLPGFREAIAEWMRTTRQFACTAEAVFATDSVASAMAVVARATLQAGDEVLIPDPVDFLLHHTVERAGAVPVRVSVAPDTTAEAFVAGMEARLTPRTRMLWLCNPHNPLGVVYSREWLKSVAEWAVRHGLRILSDEIWSDIVYAPHHHVSVASISPEISDCTATVYGFSKNFALAGLRVGCVICTDVKWRSEIVAASDAASTVFGVSVLSQVAAIAGLQHGRAWLAEFLRHLQAQRDYVVERLSRWPGVTSNPPQGTYVVFPCIRALSEDAESLCEQLREQARVALVPGATRWFGPGARGHLRICFATSRRILTEAFNRLEPVILRIAADS